MRKSGNAGERSAALFLLGLVLLFPPVLGIFSIDLLILGVPILFVYLFFAWGFLIALAARIVAADEEGRAPAPPPAACSAKMGSSWM